MRSEPAAADARDDGAVVPAWLIVGGWVLAAAGAVVWAVAVGAANKPAGLWAALLANFLFWTGVAQGGAMWAATLRLARAGWAEVPNRMGDACAAFLPISLIPAIVLFFGRAQILPWLGQDVGDRALWLNVPFVFLRDGIGLLAMTVMSLYYAWIHVRVDMGRAERSDIQPAASILSVALPATYAVVYSLLSFDFVMALSPFWKSTVLGPYFFIGAMYTGMAAIIIMMTLLRGRKDVAEHMTPARRWLDVGNLMMAFAMLTTYMFYAQLLVIWYENMPKETVFIVNRYHYPPWTVLSWVIIIGAFLGPIVLMLRKETKMHPRALSAVAALVLVTMLIERYVLVVPSIARDSFSFSFPVILLTVGFAGAFVASVGWFLNRYPLVSMIDVERREAREPHPVLLDEDAGEVN